MKRVPRLGNYDFRDSRRKARGKPRTANPENASHMAAGSGTGSTFTVKATLLFMIISVRDYQHESSPSCGSDNNCRRNPKGTSLSLLDSA